MLITWPHPNWKEKKAIRNLTVGVLRLLELNESCKSSITAKMANQAHQELVSHKLVSR